MITKIKDKFNKDKDGCLTFISGLKQCYSLHMCVRCLKEGLFMPGLNKKRSKPKAALSAEIPADTLVNAPNTTIATPLPSKVVIETIEPIISETIEPIIHDYGRDLLISPLFVINRTLSATSLIFNLLLSTE